MSPSTIVTAARVRIVLRYLAGLAVGVGLTDAATAETIIGNPHVVAIGGAIMGLIVEAAYAAAIKRGMALK